MANKEVCKSKLAVRLALGVLLALELCGGALAAGTPLPAQDVTTWQVTVGGSTKDEPAAVRPSFSIELLALRRWMTSLSGAT